jgi:uncharacterized protein
MYAGSEVRLTSLPRFNFELKGERMSNYLILSCDGGGIRGYLSSLLLQRLDKDLNIFGTNNQNIDFYAGTSTGGLIALALAQGKSIGSVVDLYANSAADIFTPLDTQWHCRLPEAVSVEGGPGINQWWQVLYDNIGSPSLRTVLETFVPGNPLLSSLANKAMVATFQLSDTTANPQSWNSLVIDNFAGSDGSGTYLYDAALSTAAAPVYFPPYQHPKFGWCSDGGLFANNPSSLAIGRAIDAGQSLDNIVVLSIGTGITPAAISVTDSRRLCFGLQYWAWFEANGVTPPFPLLNAMMDGVSASADFLCGQLLGGSQNGGRYMRVNPVLPYSVGLDDYSPAVMAMFEKVATDYFASDEWTQIESWVKSTFKK